jgi:hypothetical protein
MKTRKQNTLLFSLPIEGKPKVERHGKNKTKVYNRLACNAFVA